MLVFACEYGVNDLSKFRGEVAQTLCKTRVGCMAELGEARYPKAARGRRGRGNKVWSWGAWPTSDTYICSLPAKGRGLAFRTSATQSDPTRDMLAWHTGIHNGTRASARDAYLNRPKCCRPCIAGQFENHNLARYIRARQILVLLQRYSFVLVCTGQDTGLYLYTTVVSSVVAEEACVLH